MVTLNLAYTAPINPAGASPVLTQAQVWEGLKLKVRRAQDFVPVILDCKVLSEETLPTGNLKVTREVQFAAHMNPDDKVKPVTERCVHYAPTCVVFEQEDGSSVINVVSHGPGGEGDLMMTYVFEWRYPVVEAGSVEAKELGEKHLKMAKMAVEGSIDTIRRFVKDGKIQS
ncbi:Uu.00g031700.m01.CDS01 [Anthostomella pinea]|uniref:Uu.00g031700.m01.CDS01 n=1 Tax=Anthostomella pinea TaxID=933095 RepID=A0AAI8V915_9PEZI|nr:Uu.00g031700.m01.CDS01 [Anthostomella pinea]